MTDKPIVGVDVSKQWLDIAVAASSCVTRIENNTKAIEAWLAQIAPDMVAFEPTGGYERTLRTCLSEHGIRYVRVHPNELVAFRTSRRIKAKTDSIDARLIAQFAAEELPRREFRPAIAGDDTLRELAARRRQIGNTLHAERCRLAIATNKAVRKSISLLIAALSRNLKAVEAEIGAHLEADEKTRNLMALLQTLRGVGPVVAMTLLADLPEIGQLSAKQIAALTGLAPITRKSGTSQQRERIGYGRPSVRSALFNAARAALRHPSPFKTFFDHLVIERKKPGKVALVAVMRKILVTANAIARDQTPWRFAKA